MERKLKGCQHYEHYLIDKDPSLKSMSPSCRRCKHHYVDTVESIVCCDLEIKICQNCFNRPIKKVISFYELCSYCLGQLRRRYKEKIK